MATKKPLLTLKEQIAKAKLRALAQGIRIWKLEGTETPMYAVSDTSMDGTAYLLEFHQDNGEITCTCPGNVNRGSCKHMGAVMPSLAGLTYRMVIDSLTRLRLWLRRLFGIMPTSLQNTMMSQRGLKR